LSTIALTLAPPRSRATARLAFQVVCAVVGSGLIAGLAQISIHLGTNPVPITGQTLGVLLVGAAYGPALGAATLLLYLAEAAVGLPVLARNANGGHDTGIAVLQFAAATGGYLWGFVVASAVVGRLADRGWDRVVWSAIPAMVIGEAIIYAFGLPWLHHALPALYGGPVGWGKTLSLGLWPFLAGDTLKLVLAAGLLPISWGLLDRFRPSREA
jgi:biotin transport system substrate-specific component